MILKRWCLFASVFMVASLVITAPAASADSLRDFKKINGLQAYVPPEWFLKGYFIASEKNPGYIFGTVQDFVRTLGGTTTWLIEDLELKRVELASVEGKNPEYSLFLEAVSPQGTEYWVFVVLPHENAQAWFDARRAYHGRKAADYYGRTQSELEQALNQGIKIKAELRFLIERGDISLLVPEDEIRSRYKFQPVFDLRAGRWLNSAAKTK